MRVIGMNMREFITKYANIFKEVFELPLTKEEIELELQKILASSNQVKG